jgi:hypothetical protein
VVVAFASVIASSKQTALVLVPFFYRAGFPNYRSTLTGSVDNFLGIWAFVAVISSSKQKTLF